MFYGYSLELLLSIAGFAVSVGALVQALRPSGNGGRKVSLAIALAFLVTLLAASTFDHYQHDEAVRRSSENIQVLLRQRDRMTIDQLYSEIYPPVSYAIVGEALNGLVGRGVVSQSVEEFNLNLGSVVRVRVYSMR